MSVVNAQKETLGYQAEVKQLLQMVIHSLYSNKEIFLRELISNASDAIDKLRFKALSEPSLLENKSEFSIQIDFDKNARTITVDDNGIGMSREEAVSHLGTIAKSGTKEFFQSLSGDQSKDAHLIGQFGVGFYASFIVAEKVTVLTRRAGLEADQGVKWESCGEGDYSIETAEKSLRGTQIILQLREGSEFDEFLNDSRLRHIITKYSDHITVPINMRVIQEKSPDINPDPAHHDSQETKNPGNAPVIKTETINRATALWTLPKNDIQEIAYQEFYKHISHDFEAPLIWSHNRVEGKQEYITLLYIPAHAPYDLYNRERPHGLKLYVKRVFIMDDAEQFLPLYLRFVRGIIDSSDLPLNISREILQNNALVENIKSACTKRVLTLLENLSQENKEKYQQFWKAFGQVLKEGPGEDFANKEQIAKLLRFSSTHENNETQEVSLDDYIARMKAEQEKIYYVTSETFLAAKNSPHLEIFNKKNIEVLLLSDRVDEWLSAHLHEYAGKKFQSVSQGKIDLSKFENEQEKQQLESLQKDFESMLKQIKSILGEKVKDVRLTARLTSSPACIVADENDMGIHIQRLLKNAGQNFPSSKPVLEINPEHRLIQKLRDETDDEKFKALSLVLFDQSLLAESGQLANAAEFVSRINKLLLNAS